MRVAVAQRTESFTDYEEGCGFESHQSHASSEALGFSHLEPLSLRPVHHDFTDWLGKWPFWRYLDFLPCRHGAYR
jgi:hypothetical protein